MTGEIQRGLIAAANSPIRAVLTSVAAGITLALLVWMASILSHISYAMPALERRVSIMEARDSAVVEQTAATRETLAVLRIQLATLEREIALLRQHLTQPARSAPRE